MKSFGLPLLFVTAFGVAMAFGVSGCIQTQNSSSSDASLYGAVTGTDDFLAVHEILVSKCIVCHADLGGDANSLVAGDYVIATDPADSPLYYRLQNSDGFNGPKTMPVGAPALSSSDLATLKTWITNL